LRTSAPVAALADTARAEDREALACNNDQFAALFISKKTVQRQRVDILEKLVMRERVDLTRYATNAVWLSRSRGSRARPKWGRHSIEMRHCRRHDRTHDPRRCSR
jgi:hypothetical protein